MADFWLDAQDHASTSRWKIAEFSHPGKTATSLVLPYFT
jgi:hypothetical protein